MRLRDTARLVLGSLATYLIVAACGASGGGGFGPDGGADGGQSMKGHDGGARDAKGQRDVASEDAPSHRDAHHKGMLDGMVDAIAHPVREASADANQSGSRLKTQRLVGTDGSSTFSGMYDASLKTPCAYTGTMSDGSVRCVPSAPGVTVGVFFADAACTTPLAAVPGCSPQPPYVSVVTPATSCAAPATTNVFAVTGTWTGLVYSGTAAACAAATPAATTGLGFYGIGATPLPPSMFIAGTLTTDF